MKTAGSIFFLALFAVVILWRLNPQWFLFGPKPVRVQPAPQVQIQPLVPAPTPVLRPLPPLHTPG
jgi:hypothetical protein